nr:transposase, MuDR, MULE transposase domain protein [Tanacetum cinerariifolium]
MCTPRPRNSLQSEVTGLSKKPSDYVLSSPTFDHMLETPLDVNNAFVHAWKSNTFDHMPPTPDAPVHQIDLVSSIARFGVAIQAFLTSMRPLIIINEARLKGTYEGTNLLTVGMDNNNQIIPIVTGVCQGGESMEAWSFFLSKLKESIGVVQDMTVIFDRHPGIVSACATIFPNAFNGNTTVKETYKELVYPLQGPSSWETSTDKQNVLPPTMEKRMAGRPSNNDHFRARGESRDKTPCGTCGKKGHKSMSCKGPKRFNLRDNKRSK